MVDSIAATQEVNKIWLSSLFTDQMVWKYIATSDGVLRIYPGIEVVPKDFNPILRPWYVMQTGSMYLPHTENN